MPIDPNKIKNYQPIYKSHEPKAITPDDHSNIEKYNTSEHPDDFDPIAYDKQFVTKDHTDHFIYDPNDMELSSIPKYQTDEYGNKIKTNNGSVTPINPFDDKDMETIIKSGLYESEKNKVVETTGKKYTEVPITPMAPFIRQDPSIMRMSNLRTYNRTKTPIADLEFRKGFRHYFFTRPECYIMSINDNLEVVMSEQAQYDTDFNSTFSRMPHILSLLSPVYVTGSFSVNDINSNFCWLLSNRCMSISSDVKTSIGMSENTIKTTTDHAVIQGGLLTSDMGNTLTVKFRDTKTFEVYEYMRLWMLYIHKIKRGIFAPSYNGYRYKNTFLDIKQPTNINQSATHAIINHPYDRALDYCCSLFDFVTNETMTKILYWCKFYGLYPIEASLSGLDTDNATAITNEIVCNVTFRYQKKLMNNNLSLVEFNYNAGLTDNVGRVNKRIVETSAPFLLKDDVNEKVLKKYIGAAGMFTGSPFVALKPTTKNPLDNSKSLLEPHLFFTPINSDEVNAQLNTGITSTNVEARDDVIGTI